MPTPLKQGRIMHQISTVKTRAQHCGVSYLTTISTANAALIDARHRIVTQRIIKFF
jgi:hypothetical protein